MMKKSWIRKDQKGVSPVIATILMVAITVVLAAVLYLMVRGFTDTGDTTTQAGSIDLETEESNIGKCTFGKFTPSAGAKDVVIQIKSDAGTDKYVFDTGTDVWENDDNNSGCGLVLTFDDVGGDGDVSNGDSFLFWTPAAGDYTVSVIMSNEVVTKQTMTVN